MALEENQVPGKNEVLQALHIAVDATDGERPGLVRRLLRPLAPKPEKSDAPSLLPANPGKLEPLADAACDRPIGESCGKPPPASRRSARNSSTRR